MKEAKVFSFQDHIIIKKYIDIKTNMEINYKIYMDPQVL